MVSMQLPYEFFCFCILRKMWLGNNTVYPVKFFLPPKELSAGFNLDSLRDTHQTEIFSHKGNIHHVTGTNHVLRVM